MRLPLGLPFVFAPGVSSTNPSVIRVNTVDRFLTEIRNRLIRPCQDYLAIA